MSAFLYCVIQVHQAQPSSDLRLILVEVLELGASLMNEYRLTLEEYSHSSNSSEVMT